MGRMDLGVEKAQVDDVQFTSVYRNPYIYWETKSMVPVGFASSPAIDFVGNLGAYTQNTSV